MRSVLLLALVGCCAVAGVARSDSLLNDRTLDLAGDAQGSPSVALTFNVSTGYQLVTVWEQQSGSVRQFNVGVAVVPLGSGTIADLNAPPAPTGYIWFGDPIVRAPSVNVASDGTFYLFGQVRSSGVSPFTYGLGFLRGKAQIGATVTWETPQVIETFGTNTANQRYINALAMDVSPDTSVVQISYINTKPAFGTEKSVWYRTSPDGGLSWGAPVPAGSDSLFPTSSSKVQCGPARGDVTIFWGKIIGLTRQTICRRSTDFGATFGSIEVVQTFPFLTQATPHGSSGPVTPATEMNRIGGVPTIFMAGSEEMNLASFTYPDPTTSPSQVEIEPNGVAATATLTSGPGVVLRGAIASGAPPDTDLFAFNLTTGVPVMLLADSVTSALGITYGWLGPDGRSLLTNGTVFAGSEGRVGFTPPTGGSYYLRVVKFSGTTGAYRIRTATQAAPDGGALDQHDVFITGTQPSQPWATPVNVSQGSVPVGYDESGVSLASNLDGELYASWFDWQFQPGTEIARRVMARSADAGQTWSSPVVLSTALSNWLVALGTTAPTLSGPWCAGTTDGTDIHDVWVDVRNGDPDLYGVTVHRALAINFIDPTSVSAHPGDFVNINLNTHNLDGFFGWSLRLTGSLSRNWSLPTTFGTLTAGATAQLSYSFTVPDSAAPGMTTLFIEVKSDLPPYTQRASAVVPLTILSGSAAVGDRATALDLRPITPNPATGSARVSYSLARSGHARVVVIGIDGRRIRSLEDADQSAGPHVSLWDGRDESGRLAPPGAYVVRLEVEGRALWKRMVLLR